MRKNQNAPKIEMSVFSAEYWRTAAKQVGSTKMLVLAALIVALRVAVKALKIPIVTGVNLTFDCYVNALGSMIYGPVAALMVGAVSDTLGCMLFPSGTYFFPFIFVEMGSAFIFALFLWRRKIDVKRVFASKFTVNLICNIILTPIFMKWMYYWLGDEKGVTYKLVTTVRVAKNIVLLPLETLLITVFLGIMIPVLPKLGINVGEQPELRLKKKHVFALLLLFVLAAAFVAVYWYFFILKKA